MVIYNYRIEMKIKLLLILFTLCISTITNAHVGHHGPSQGWLHPLTGLDHFIAMVAVGAWSAIIGGRAVWVVPSCFVIFMFIGSLLGLNHVELPYTEVGILLSVIVLGIAIATKNRIPVYIATIFTAIFGVCHGFAHGYELPVIDHPNSYIAGFLITTALLHVLGLVVAHFCLKSPKGLKLLQGLGVIFALIGCYLFIHNMT